MNGTHVIAFLVGVALVLACQMFAAFLLRKQPVPADETAYLDDDDAPPGHVSMERLCAQRLRVVLNGRVYRDMSLYELLLSCEMDWTAGNIVLASSAQWIVEPSRTSPSGAGKDKQ